MISKAAFRRMGPVQWEIPADFRKDMRVPVRVFASEPLLEAALQDRSIEQAINGSTLPGVVGQFVVMPDVHQGYGFPIGGVAATEFPGGVISPGGIGYDINCGVRLLSSRIPFEAVSDHLEKLAAALFSSCPSGVGSTGQIRLRRKDLHAVCREGAGWGVKNGYGRQEDLASIEAEGCLEGAEPTTLSKRAADRGRPQLGTLGAGNHFIEVDVVQRVLKPEAARGMGLLEGHLALQIHTGSRGFGHQVCSDYVREFQNAVGRYGIHLPDRELVCAPMDSPEGKRYFGAMNCAANYAFCNRQVISHFARRAFEAVLPGLVDDWDLHVVYDLAHNIGKAETHIVEGRRQKLLVHRKGATRAFGPGSEELPPGYQELGQPVLVPGSMGTASWVLVAAGGAMEQTFGSCCHGAGRVMSRSQAKKQVWGAQLLQDLKEQGIAVQAGSMPGLAEEAPSAYKEVDSVVDVVCQAGIAERVARLRPVAVVKG